MFVLEVGPFLNTLSLPVEFFFFYFCDEGLHVDFRKLFKNFQICHQESFHVNFAVFEVDQLIFFLGEGNHFPTSKLRFLDFRGHGLTQLKFVGIK